LLLSPAQIGDAVRKRTMKSTAKLKLAEVMTMNVLAIAGCVNHFLKMSIAFEQIEKNERTWQW
jgi:hypothetical protein